MSNSYIEYTFIANPLQPTSDILIAELGEVGFESFVENELGVLAYIQKKNWSQTILNPLLVLKNVAFEISFQMKEIPLENWNANWESNFEAIHLGSDCIVRAPFHDKPDVEFDIVIEPKMSFGTGHHETTFMMLGHILKHEFQGKKVLDMGSGTGVLAILACMKGAVAVDAIDIDHWCFLNAKENALRNNCALINVMEGDIDLLNTQKYDVILANINRNILLSHIPRYAKHLNNNGLLFLSGFYETDIALLTKICSENGLKYQEKTQKNEWISLKLLKS